MSRPLNDRQIIGFGGLLTRPQERPIVSIWFQAHLWNLKDKIPNNRDPSVSSSNKSQCIGGCTLKIVPRSVPVSFTPLWNAFITCFWRAKHATGYHSRVGCLCPCCSCQSSLLLALDWCNEGSSVLAPLLGFVSPNFNCRTPFYVYHGTLSVIAALEIQASRRISRGNIQHINTLQQLDAKMWDN